jgi:hypothetical protein
MTVGRLLDKIAQGLLYNLTMPPPIGYYIAANNRFPPPSSFLNGPWVQSLCTDLLNGVIYVFSRIDFVFSRF